MELKSMKKVNILVVMVTFVMAGVCALMLAGCGGTNPIGTWGLDRIVTDSVVVRASDTDKGAYASEFENEIVLNEDGTGTVKINAGQAVNATWTQTDKSITISVGDNLQSVYVLSGAELIYENGDIKYIYKKSA